MNLVKETCLSHQTIGRRIDDLGDNIEGTLKDKLSACVLYSLALDESTDQSDTAQLVIFIRGIDENFNIIKEMLGTCGLSVTTFFHQVLNYYYLTVYIMFKPKMSLWDLPKMFKPNPNPNPMVRLGFLN